MDYTQELLALFRQHLLDQSVSPNTLKNYLSDLRVFINFVTSQFHPLSRENLSTITLPDVTAKYQQYLSAVNPSATVKRRLSSLRHFPPPPSIQPEPPPPPPAPVPPPEVQPLPESPSSPSANFNLIKLLPEVFPGPAPKISSPIPPVFVYVILMLIFILSFFATYFLLQ
ncbi:MAG: hypothetical protein UY22_C0050G0019 [Candidatus Amesbacteria bacterium GW2011_GWC1_48_10]|uniref:Core-binding (CB) domain-containing protein n=1 Tax=Candidatus Amesbacteria bacterium GW2011_GWC1_48_10 TaxID=1618365 RepID=A0A0G1U9J3_9BACT|nr:MAG: hypothetical protein UY22_C0050G0019 [Candidatus Amesbacteria bacterium GW2011_GWC1_48_10]